MIHGTLTGYHHHKCRCVDCRCVHLAYQHHYVAAQRAKGICCECRDALSPKSIRFCAIHLDKHRLRMKARYARQHPTPLEPIPEQG